MASPKLLLSTTLRLACLICLPELVGCGGRELIPTPNLYVNSDENPFADVPEALQGTELDVLYVTDRSPEVDDEGKLEGYGYGRSYSLAFGSAILRIGDEEMTWEKLVEGSRTEDRSGNFEVALEKVLEKGRFPETPLPVVADEDGYAKPDPAAVEAQERKGEQLLDEVRRRLALSPTKDVYVFIHGYNNGFEHSTAVIGEIWHFLARRGVPIAYSWPAGRGGLRGYFYDRESGEFTIYHAKYFLRLLASCEEIRKIHLIAHSRGTDVTLTALREIFFEIKNDMKPRSERKLGNVIIAAPDLDIDVISQRIVAEEFTKHIARLTLYMSKHDAALGLSTWLFQSRARVGRLRSGDDMPVALRRRVKAQSTQGMTSTTALVDSRVDTGFIGHSYFYTHPAVSSDLILLLRDDLDPGVKSGRPLENLGGILYAIDDDYPRFEESSEDGDTIE